MADIIKVAALLVMLIMLFLGIAKKLNVAPVLWVLGIVSFTVLGLATGVSPMGEKTSGSLFLDGFASFESYFTASWASSCAALAVVYGYIAIMKAWNVTDMFVYAIVNPVKRVVKNPYILAGVTIFIGAIMAWAFNNTMTVVLLLLAIWYPVMLACGNSKATAGTAILLGASFFRWGPADACTLFMLNAVESPMTVADWWIKYQLGFYFVLIAILIVCFAFISKYFDSKETDVKYDTSALVEGKTMDSFGIPKFYVLYPLLPITIMLLATLFDSITFGIIPSYIATFVLILIIESIRTKNFVDTVNNGFAAFVEGIKSAMNILVLVTGATLFSAALNAIGGMSVMLKWIDYIGGGALAMAILGIVLATIIVMISGQCAPNSSVFGIFFKSISEITGGALEPLLSVSCSCVGFASVLSMVHPQTLVITGTCEVKLPTLLKRLVPYVIIGAVCSLIYSFVILGV